MIRKTIENLNKLIIKKDVPKYRMVQIEKTIEKLNRQIENIDK